MQLRRGMLPEYKIFCDESCHLPHDGCDIMVFGALRCDALKVDDVSAKIASLREQHNYRQELKWTKLVHSQMPFYRDLIEYFANNSALRFKATVVLNKKTLDHSKYNAGSAGTFYYKMAYYALRDLLVAGKGHRLYLDYMDTLGATKTRKLQEILSTGSAGWITTHIIRSHESQLVQLCDLLIGAIAYANRTDIPTESAVKKEFILALQSAFKRSLTAGTPPWEDKFNIFMFSPRVS